MGDTCESCRFFQDNTCRRYPPSTDKSLIYLEDWYDEYPKRHSTTPACGEHKPRDSRRVLWGNLSPENYEICYRLHKGQPVKAVAQSLGLTLNSIHSRLTRLRHRVGAESMNHLLNLLEKAEDRP